MKKKWIIILIVAAFVMISDAKGLFDNYENQVYDSFFQGENETDDRIVIVAIDDTSINMLGQWPFDRSYHGELIDIISQGNPAAIGIDLLFDSYSNATSDDILAASIEAAGNVVMAEQVKYTPKINGYKQGSDTLVRQFPELLTGSVEGHINTYPDGDRVIRRTTLFAPQFVIDDASYNYLPSFAYQLFKTYTENADISDAERSTFEASLTKYAEEGKSYFIDYKGMPRQYDNIPYALVYNEMIPPSYFEDKIVLIGPYANGLLDEYITPVVQEQPMFGVEIHANILQNLFDDSLKTQAPEVFNLVTILVLAILTFFISERFSPLKGLSILILIAVGYLFIGKKVYEQGYVLELFYPLLTMGILYVTALAYHYLEQLNEKRRIRSLFGRYVAPQVVNKILEDSDSINLGGERRFISVLFVDIRGFTPLSERCEPEEIVEILNSYLDLCEQSIFTNKGTLDKFIGDATMAIYNAPLELEDHAFYAVKTAWDMKQGAALLKEGLLERFGKTVDFGIGVNTGYAVVGNIGSKRRMDYTAIGDTVNTSARLESNAKPGQILISQTTYDLVKERVDVKPLGEIKVKGKETMIPIYEVEGIRSDDTKSN
ncbi:MAG: adenylate cyclase [Clostridiales bacterium]|nr:adenylate cyclase [Clostridiales bacterium]